MIRKIFSEATDLFVKVWRARILPNMVSCKVLNRTNTRLSSQSRKLLSFA